MSSGPSSQRRLRVASSRQLAPLLARLRVGDTVLQSGTTAIDRQGNVRGEGDVAQQVDAIMAIAASGAWARRAARLDDVVRSRIYVTDVARGRRGGRARSPGYLRDARPAATLVRSTGWRGRRSSSRSSSTPSTAPARSAQRISSGSAPSRTVYAYSRAVRVGRSRVHLRLHALRARRRRRGPRRHVPPDRARRWTRSSRRWHDAGGAPGDLVYTKTFLDRPRQERRVHAGVRRGRSATCVPSRRCSASRRSSARSC